VRTGRSFDVEYRFVRPDGEVRYVHSHTDLIRDEQGRIRRTFGIAQDITERKRAEEELRQSERQLAEAQCLAHVGSWSCDLQSNALSWSDELYRIFGVDPQDFNPAYEDFVTDFVHAEDRALVKDVIENALKTQEPFSFYNRILRPDGEERVIHARGNVVSDGHGNPIRMFGAAQDVTERKRAEDENRRLLCELTERVKELTALHEAADILRQGRADTASVLRDLTEILPPSFRYPEITAARLRLGGVEAETAGFTDSPSVLRTDFTTADGQHGSIEVIYTEERPHALEGPFMAEERRLINTVADMLRVAYDRRQAEEQLESYNEKLRALSARLQSVREEESIRIAREIHDELGSRLTSLRWDIESLDSVVYGTEDASHYKVLREKTEKMLRLTDAIIGVVRRIASELRPSILDDLGLAAAIEWQSQQFQTRTGIACRCDCVMENLSLTQEQATAVFRIFQEAMTNIVRHAHASAVHVTLTERDERFEMSIRDNGRGITEAERDDPNAIGLLGMRERTLLMGGIFRITGRKGKGTVVSIEVPVAPKPAEARRGQKTRAVR